MIRKLVTESQFSLRVLPGQSQIWPFRRPTLVAFDGPESAKAILTALPRRPLARGCEVQLLFCTKPLKSDAVRATAELAEPDGESIARQLLQTKAAIEALGNRVSSLGPIGNRAQAILDEAKRVDAECILIGNGQRDILSDLVGQSVAATVTANATCPVEIISARPEDQAADAGQTIAA
jgi:nucleotide-binding universal stress UspA family protein